MPMQINSAIFDEFPIIKTRRLTLREIRPTDADPIYNMRASQRVNQFIARDEMAQPEQARHLVAKTIEAYQKRQGIGWAGILRNQDQIIGTCGYNQIDFANLRAEIGGELAPDFWGKNIALEAFSAIIQFGFREMHLHSIEAKVSPKNRGALFLLKSLGFEKEAHFKDRIHFRGKFLDMAVYSLLNTYPQP